MLAHAFGIRYVCLDGERELAEQLADLDFENGINLIEIPIDRDAYPNYSSRR
jgi:acetolactate synthase I/II/III large subunit